MSERVAHVDLNGKWATTSRLSVAMVNGYIGEIPLIPTKIASAIGVPYPSWTSYYYGTPDARLKRCLVTTERRNRR